jgi:hypothetical protein
MQNKAYEILANKLKKLPDSALERVNGYVDALLEPTSLATKPYVLTAEQQNILDSQLTLSPGAYTMAEELYDKLKIKIDV